MKISVIIPAHNEAGSIESTVAGVCAALEGAGIEYEVIVVDDSSTDGTIAVVEELASGNPAIHARPSHRGRGFGNTVRDGLAQFEGDAVAVMMADGSDDPDDLVGYVRVLEQGFDCAFGSRFTPGSKLSGYPPFKLILNRIVNAGIRLLFRHGYNDTTNAFKAYRREVIETVQPLLANHFNLTVELPLKAIVRGHSYAVIPINWRGRELGTSKLALSEMGSRYAFIVLYVLLERYLSRGDYLRPGLKPRPGREGRPRLGPGRGHAGSGLERDRRRSRR